jgi:glycosyltransferase involved in cell wall biosynthesis
MPPFLSIILATYNRAHLLPRAICSVLDQDNSDWELLIVDDGSTDDTVKTVRSFTDQDSRIQILINPHQGLAMTRNSGIQKARGEYVTFLDSDDEYKEGHLRLHVEFLRKNTQIEMLHGKVDVIGEPYVPDARDLTKKIHIEECTQPGTFFIKRDLLLEVGGFPVVSFGEDSALLSLLQKKGSHVVLSPYRTYRYYNTEPDSMCNTLLRKMASHDKGTSNAPEK